MIRFLPHLALAGALLLSSCSADSGEQAQASRQTTAAGADSPSAPPKTPGEALITRFTWPQPPKGDFAPQEECAKLQGSYDFRIALADAVLARDADALLALVADDVALDFGGAAGKAEFTRRLNDKAFAIWDRLETLLPLGCGSDRADYLVIPSFFNRDIGAVDSYMAMVVTGSDISLLNDPVRDAEVIRPMSWELVELVRSLKPDEPYQLVTAISDGARGFVATERLRSLLDYRVLAERREGEWKVTALIAGD